MSTKKFQWSITFAVRKHYTKEFLNWMEKNHIPKIHATGFFEKGYEKRFEEKQEGLYDAVQYILTPISPQSWKDYNQGPYPELREELMDEWGGDVRSGNLQMMAIASPVEFVE